MGTAYCIASREYRRKGCRGFKINLFRKTPTGDLKQNQFLENHFEMLNSLKLWLPTLTCQSHWQPVGCNFKSCRTASHLILQTTETWVSPGLAHHFTVCVLSWSNTVPLFYITKGLSSHHGNSNS